MRVAALLLLLLGAVCTVQAEFIEVTSEAFTTGPGGWHTSTWPDYNNDGWPDLHTGGVYLYHNNGDGTFTRLDTTGFEAGANYSAYRATWADVDNDGDLDVVQSCMTNSQEGALTTNYYYMNDGAPDYLFYSYPVYTNPINNRSGQACFVDSDRNGEAEIYLGTFGNWEPYGINRDRWFGRIFDGFWQDETATAIPQLVDDTDYRRQVRGVVACDYDNDGDTDIFVPVYGVTWNESWENCLWNNDGAGVFTDVAEDAGVAVEPHGRYEVGLASGASWADYDNDGDFDLSVGNIHGWNALYRNEDDGTFTNITESAGLPTPVPSSPGEKQFHTPAWVDYDNDGDMDLWMTQWYEGYNAYVYRNDAPNNPGHFTRVDHQIGFNFGEEFDQVFTFGFADYDRDGDMDVHFHGGIGEFRGHHLFRNDLDNNSDDHHWLCVKLTGDPETSGYTALQGRVEIFFSDGTRSPVKQVEATSADAAMNMHTLHFGLGEYDSYDSLVVTWPDGVVETYTQDQLGDVDQYIEITQGDVFAPEPGRRTELPETTRLAGVYPNPFNASARVSVELAASQNVTLTVYDITGRQVTVLHRGELRGGTHRFHVDGATWASGTYLVQLTTGSSQHTERMVLIK